MDKMIPKEAQEMVKDSHERLMKLAQDKPELVVGMAVAHLIPMTISVVGIVQLCKLRLQLKIEKERTKQLEMKLSEHSRHHFHHRDKKNKVTE